MSATSDKQTGCDPTNRGVPLLDLSRQHAPLKEEIAAALTRIWDTGAFVLGPEVKQLEAGVAQYCQVRHAIGCASGSDALLLALMAVDIGPGDEVILPSFTFFATASAVTRLGAKPVFADIDPATFTVAPAAVERLVGPATKAILPVHLFGQCADMEALGRIAQSAGVPLIEDCAQAIGAEFDHRRAGSIGEVGCLSFYPTKNLGGAGDGGMLLTNDDALAHKLRLLRVHGMEPRYFHKFVGVNSRLDSFQAAVLNVKLPHLEDWSERRGVNARRYDALFAASGLDRSLILPSHSPRCRHVWNQYVVRVPEGNRDRLRAFLTEHKIGTEVYYPLGLHMQECFRYLGYAPGDLPETDRAAQEVLALPIFPELTATEQEFLVDRMAAFFHAAPSSHVLTGPKFLNRQGVRSDGAN